MSGTFPDAPRIGCGSTRPAEQLDYASQRVRRRPRILPPVYLLATVIVMLGLHFAFPLRSWSPAPRDGSA